MRRILSEFVHSIAVTTPVFHLAQLVLMGVQKRSVVGLLSLFEHYGSCEVGSHLKTPELPIWVIYAESHFTVLFSTDCKLVETSSLAPFDVHYHDQLGQMDGAYVLTVGEGPGKWHSTRETPLLCGPSLSYTPCARSRCGLAAAQRQRPRGSLGPLHPDEVRFWRCSDWSCGGTRASPSPPFLHRWRGASIDWNGSEVMY